MRHKSKCYDGGMYVCCELREELWGAGGGRGDYQGGIELSLNVSFLGRPGGEGNPGERTGCA